MVNQVVWQTIVKDCIIPQQSAWLTTVQDKLSHGKADQSDLMALAKAIDSYLVSVEGLHRASTASEGIHCEVLEVIEVDSGLLKTLLRDMALQLAKGQPSGRADSETFQEVVRETLAKLRSIFLKYPEEDVAIALIKEWDPQKLASSSHESDSSSFATLASSVSGKSLPALAGVSPSFSTALTGESGGERQSGSNPGSQSAATSSQGWMSLAGGDPDSYNKFTQSLGALLKGRRRTRDTAEDQLAAEVQAERKALGIMSAHDIGSTLSQGPADYGSSRSASVSLQDDGPAPDVNAEQTTSKLRDKIVSAVSSHMPPGQSLRPYDF